MEKKKSFYSHIFILIPLFLGILSLLSFCLYYYSANHAPYSYVNVIVLGPILSFIGIVFSIITFKKRKQNPTLWLSGFLICLVVFILSIAVIILLMLILSAMYKGTWL